MSRCFSEWMQTSGRIHKQTDWISNAGFCYDDVSHTMWMKRIWWESWGSAIVWSDILSQINPVAMAASFPAIPNLWFWALQTSSRTHKKDHHHPPHLMTDWSSCLSHVNVRLLFRESACDSVSMREGLLCGFESLFFSVWQVWTLWSLWVTHHAVNSVFSTWSIFFPSSEVVKSSKMRLKYSKECCCLFLSSLKPPWKQTWP